MKKFLTAFMALHLVVLAPLAGACGAHIALNPEEFGFFGRTAIKLAGLGPKEPVFKLKHVPMVKAPLGSEQEIVVEYERPWFSDDVKVVLHSTAGIQLPDKTLELEDYDGTIKIRYSLEKSGYNYISLRVSGTHRGDEVTQSSIVYIRPKTSDSKDSLQVTAR